MSNTIQIHSSRYSSNMRFLWCMKCESLNYYYILFLLKLCNNLMYIYSCSVFQVVAQTYFSTKQINHKCFLTNNPQEITLETWLGFQSSQGNQDLLLLLQLKMLLKELMEPVLPLLLPVGILLLCFRLMILGGVLRVFFFFFLGSVIRVFGLEKSDPINDMFKVWVGRAWVRLSGFRIYM